MGIFSRTRKSERVNGSCCICESKIDYLYKPVDQNDQMLLFSHSDIDLVNICKKCGSLRHLLCSSERKEKIKSEMPNVSSAPTFAEAFQNAVVGGEREDQILREALIKETTGLECPLCGSFETLKAFVKKDRTIVKIKSGKRTD